MSITRFVSYIAFGTVVAFFWGCNTGEQPEGVLASAFDEHFTKVDLLERMPKNYASDDSARLADQIINNWLEDRVVLQFAEENLKDSQKDFSDQLEGYRQNLVIYAFERELVEQKLDTVISETELLTYYGENVENFKLRTNTVKVRFVKLSTDAPKIKEVEAWFLSDSEEDLELLDSYCLKYAENYFLQGDVWLYLQEVLNEVPIPVNDWDNFLPNTSYYKFEYGSFQYLVRIFDYKFKGDVSPLSLEQDRIEELILNKRKLDLINQMRTDVLNEARSKNKIQLRTQ